MSQSASGPSSTQPSFDFDPGVLRQKYREERDKRLRPEGGKQYVKISGNFGHFIDDPNADPDFTRKPLSDHVDALVIGGGFGGLIAATRLCQAGLESVRIVDKAADFGGTWYWNRYPGAQCDIESFIYLPLLEDTGYIPREKYARGPEIFEHAQRIGRKFDLYRRALFQTQVTEAVWSEAENTWIVSTDRGDRMKARYVVLSSGPLNRPQLPGIPGIDRFKGHTFHTSRWDYGYTGGDPNGNMTKLSDKRVAVIGTGATAIQCVPALGACANQLFVFQRTPSSVDVRGNAPTDPQWADALKPGWQRERMQNFNMLVNGRPQPVDLVSDGWTDIIRSLGGFFNAGTDMPINEVERLTELADFKKMNAVRARVDEVVEDKSTAEALKPWYRQFCKRPTFSDDYLPTFNRPNVSLIDTKGKGVESITETGIVFDGVEYPVDCIIFATGFELGTSDTRYAGVNVVGREGKSLAQHWVDGPRTFKGFSIHGFPNLFLMGNTQTGATVNVPHGYEDQAANIVRLIDHVQQRQGRTVEPTADAEAAWVATIKDKASLNRQFLIDCTPGYYNNEGKPGQGFGLFDEAYGGGAVEFAELLQAWATDGRYDGLTFA